ncbi:FecR family protein [Pedobacter sp. NJ-S-72]
MSKPVERVQVLGTHFNVAAYDDEPVVKTTLLEGSVKLRSQNTSGLLKPGEQGSINANGELKVIQRVDLEEVTAWKNGFFQFENANIVQIMTKAARWYDINVKYEGKIPTTLLSGKVSRNVDLSGLINIMQFEGIHFRIEKNNITIIN